MVIKKDVQFKAKSLKSEPNEQEVEDDPNRPQKPHHVGK